MWVCRGSARVMESTWWPLVEKSNVGYRSNGGAEKL